MRSRLNNGDTGLRVDAKSNDNQMCNADRIDHPSQTPRKDGAPRASGSTGGATTVTRQYPGTCDKGDMALRSLDTPGKFPTPKTILRISTLFCLVAAVLLALLARGSQGLARDLGGFLFIPFLLFGLFYFEYAIMEAMVKRDLDFRFGYLQAFGSWAITLFATLAILFAKLAGKPSPELQENVLLLMGVFGEIVFVANVVWTYLGEAGSSPQRTTLTGQKSRTPAKKATRSSGWPQSPAKVFGIATAFFLAVGGILVAVRPLGPRLPFPWHGHVLSGRGGIPVDLDRGAIRDFRAGVLGNRTVMATSVRNRGYTNSFYLHRSCRDRGHTSVCFLGIVMGQSKLIGQSRNSKSVHGCVCINTVGGIQF